MRFVATPLLSLALVFLGCSPTAQAAIPATEQAVLAAIYASTAGASWTTSTNWTGAAGTECTWFGVTCDSSQDHVTGINLQSNNLVGPLPSLSGLTALQSFAAYNNQLTGSIPSLSGLTALQSFFVNNNQLTGSIPSLSGLTALQNISVSNNQLTGSIPSLSGLTALQLFYAASNQLTGPIPSLSGLTALAQLYVNDNQLTGSIPSLSGLTALQLLVANNNRLTGAVPAAPINAAPAQSNICGNSLVSSGTAAIDAAWVTATGVAWLTCQTSSVPPTCALTANPASIAAGGSSTLRASCPGATSYVWSANSGFGSTVTTGTVSPTVTTTYTVAGVNSAGTGAVARATVTVTVTTPTTPPVCTLTATPSSIIPGSTSFLAASCSPAATSYVWTGGTCAGRSAPSCVVAPTASTTYTVTGANAGGTGTAASVTVTVNAGNANPGGVMTSFATRGTVTPTAPMYGSFALSNSSVMYIAVRGPSLGTLGYTQNPLDLPNLGVYDASGKDALGSVATGCPGGSTVSDYYAGLGGALNVRDTCVSGTPAAGVYTFTINPNTPSSSGELLFEVRVNPSSTTPGGVMTSFGTRGTVTPAAPMYGSFALANSSVMYIAVRGPSLGTLGYTQNPLDLPNLHLYDASGQDVLGSVATGCLSGSTVSDYYANLGGALSTRDTCVSATLPGGVYTFTINPNTPTSSGELLFEVRVNP